MADPAEVIEVSPQLRPDVDRAVVTLTEALGPSLGTVSGRWREVRDERGRPAVELTLSDWSGTVSRRLSLEELRDTTLRELRIYRLWGDLLQIHSQKRLERMRELARQADGG